ncbi:MAG TPA: hypothetical protein VMZ27_04405, partial [Candidatus Saccharimonadales bacterium]|nr:hypothetical protein [Candidatus Saccharimonadales bacterium]
MSKRAWCSVIHSRLARHGVPSHQIERLLVELNEHWEELHEAGLRRGLPPADADAEADKLLGEPEQLAAAAINGFRQSSWIGRHIASAVRKASTFLESMVDRLKDREPGRLGDFNAHCLKLQTNQTINIMNETPQPRVRRKAVIIASALLGTIVFAAVLFAAGIFWACTRHAALTRQLQGIYVFNRASDGVIYTADLRADGLCYFRVQPPGWDLQPPSFSYSTSRGDISAGVPGAGFENGLP